MTTEERFWQYVQKSPDPDGCWNWIGTKRLGYGRFHIGKRKITAHHFLLPPIPKGMKACHKCDNTACVRPDHIFMGTQGDNVLDCNRKGRAAPNWIKMRRAKGSQKGSQNGNAKLSEEDVKFIRNYPRQRGSSALLAAKFSIHKGTIFRIWERKIWN